MTQKTILVHGASVRYRITSSGPESLIMLHGWRSSSKSWRPLEEILVASGRFSLYLIDLAGFGDSEAPPHAYSLADYANTVLAVMDREGVEKASFLGHSFGARVAAFVAAEHPERVHKLYLAGSGGTRRSGHETIGFFAHLAKPFFTPHFMQPLRRMIYRILGAEDYIETPKLTETLKRVVNEDMDAIFPRIAAETVILWGEKDAEAPLAYGRHVAKAIPHAKLEIIPEAGHYAFIDKPIEFADIILRK